MGIVYNFDLYRDAFIQLVHTLNTTIEEHEEKPDIKKRRKNMNKAERMNQYGNNRG